MAPLQTRRPQPEAVREKEIVKERVRLMLQCYRVVAASLSSMQIRQHGGVLVHVSSLFVLRLLRLDALMELEFIEDDVEVVFTIPGILGHLCAWQAECHVRKHS